MKITTPGQILTPLLALMQLAVSAATAAELTNTLRHVYVVGPDPSGRAMIGKALTRLGYVSTGSGSNDAGVAAAITLKMNGDSKTTSSGFSYTEISTPGEEGNGANYIVARQGLNQSASGLELSSMLARRAGVERDDSSGAWWRRMVGFSAAPGADSEGGVVRVEY